MPSRNDPPTVSSGPELQAWMCRAHNTVNRRLGKPTFNCDLVAARWAPLDCGDGAEAACDLTVGAPGRGRR
jgi:mitochondrial FAD-linked sulfhydryl oxidase